jgi:hypothetical protein
MRYKNKNTELNINLYKPLLGAEKRARLIIPKEKFGGSFSGEKYLWVKDLVISAFGVPS